MRAETIKRLRRRALLLAGLWCSACIFVDEAAARAPIEGIERSHPVAPAPSEPANAATASANSHDAAREDAVEEAEAIAGWLPDRWHAWGPLAAQCLYTGEAFDRLRGGIPNTDDTARYRGNLDVTLTFDTAAADWWDGGEVFVYLQHAHGTTLTPHFVGDGQYYSNIDTGPKAQALTQLGEVWYKHNGDDSSWFKIGKQDANADFAFADLGGDFLNSSFATLPNIPMPFWPCQAFGAAASRQVDATCRVGGGIYDQGRDIQQWWTNTAERGAFCLAQADLLPFAECEGALLTQVRLGTWYLTSDTWSVVGDDVYAGNYGVYVTVDQMLWVEEGSAEQGLGAFVQASWCPADRNQVDRHVAGGLVYRGLVPQRDTDTIGLATTVLFFSPELRDVTGQVSETAIEAFYKARWGDWFAVQPDVQYIASPSGLFDDALVAGVRFELIF